MCGSSTTSSRAYIRPVGQGASRQRQAYNHGHEAIVKVQTMTDVTQILSQIERGNLGCSDSRELAHHRPTHHRKTRHANRPLSAAPANRRGGHGRGYMAEQKDPVKRRVALKIIKPGMDSRRVIARFEAERQAPAPAISTSSPSSTTVTAARFAAPGGICEAYPQSEIRGLRPLEGTQLLDNPGWRDCEMGESLGENGAG